MTAAVADSIDFLSDDAIGEAFAEIAAHRLAKKTCPDCKKELPLVPAAFRPDPASPDGYSQRCVICDIEDQRRVMDACVAEANLTVNAGLQGRAIRMAARASDASNGVPHMKVLLQRYLEAFGGPEGIAAAKVATYLAAKDGSMQRVKILDGVDRMSVKVAEAGGADMNVEGMTDDELKRVKAAIEDRLKRQIDVAAERVA
jgi:hypothetical protein